MTTPEIGHLAAKALGTHASPELVRRVADATAGIPWLVQRVVQALRVEDSETVPEPLIPREVIDQLAYDLEAIHGELGELLLALAVGFDLSDNLPPTLKPDDGIIDHLVGKARAAGLLLPGGHLVPVIRQALLETTPPYRVRALQRMLVETIVDGHLPLDHVAESLAHSGLRDVRIALALEHAADTMLDSQPSVAGRLYQEAVSAGADELLTAARRAQAAAAVGDLNGAARITEFVFEQPDPPDISRAVDVAAATWAQRGMLAHSADLYRRRGPEKVGTSAGLAVVAMMGVGDLSGAESMADVVSLTGNGSFASVAAALMGQGVRHSVCGHPPHALPSLIQASDMMTASGSAVPLPESPAALATLAALHAGDLGVADSVLDSALAGEQGGAVAQPGLLLLRGWVAMQGDRPERAQHAVAEATAGEARLVPRDILWLRALEVGLARRADDMPGLVNAWHRARESVLHVDIDLYNLMPLAELLIAATRLRDAERLDPQLGDAWALLERLGDPPLWSVPLHWAAVQAAILAERPQELGPHAAALVRASDHDHLAATLAAAGRAWLSVLAGTFDVRAVESAARGLAAVGMTWDGARLAGHASARAPERKDMARLLACARDLRPSAAPVASAHELSLVSGPHRSDERDRDDTGLSAREREVAHLVLEGKTYPEIGDAIFISPRTVEHHVASIRRRLGATTRAELLAELRRLLGSGASNAD
ncbi:MAG: helix-turn-helix transcriptional regulator [Homoserinimonas sp.]